MSKLLDTGLIQITKKVIGEEVPSPSNKGGISRRSFLKVLGATSATALTACAKDTAEKIIPYSKAEPESIPGTAVWYSSTCTECSAGCGITVRTREGRAVKIEGSPIHPVNKGGLCGLGQSALQDMYDPDRVRQPMKRVTSDTGKSVFKPITWNEAYAEIAQVLSEDKEIGFISESFGGGALDELVGAWSKSLRATHVVYNALEPSAWAQATELVFGKRGLPQLDFEKPDVVLNFGADFLETWISPCEYAKSWANGRRKEKPVRFIHIEPRASLTAANADHFFSSKPGSEAIIAFSILKAILDSGKTGGFTADQVSNLKGILNKFSIKQAAQESGISQEKLDSTVNYLLAAKTSLVIAGGTLTMSMAGLGLCLASQLLNVALGNVGTSFDVSKLRVAESSVSALQALIQKMNDKKVGVLFVHKTNPAFTLPADFNFSYAAKYVKLVVSFSSQLDETANNAHILLPANTGLESWGDMNPQSGVYSLIQPTMTPVFDSRSLGDQLLQIASAASKTIEIDGVNLSKTATFEDVLKSRWKKLYSKHSSIGKSFEIFWNESLERGGLFVEEAGDSSISFKGIPESLKDIVAVGLKFSDRGTTESPLVFYPFTSVKGFDGRAANRPWMQELPDPMSQVVWDSWVELHPDTAQKLGIAQGDLVSVVNYHGELNLPAYITPYVNPAAIAVPLGQGHTEYGRFASESSAGGNTFNMVPALASSDGHGLALFSTMATVKRARGQSLMVQAQKEPSQHDREISRTSYITEHGLVETPKKTPHFQHYLGQEEEPSLKVGEHEEGHGEHAPHELKQMWVQREFPVYHWGLSIDLNACTGCSACVVACHAENNVPVVGKEAVKMGRRMSWIQITRYHDGSSDDLQVSFLPMTCQHCGNAPCEPVCPVYATYHNEEGLNAMIYNRCVGTRYCANNCSYKVRRFNWAEYEFPTPLDFQLNPDVTKRVAGVMEKCTFCVQRIVETKDSAKDIGRLVKDGEVKPACVQSCPTDALVFGNLNDPESKVSKAQKGERSYKILDYHLNTQPSVSYLDRLRYEKI